VQLQEDIRSLAEQIGGRHEGGHRYTLLLGAGIADAAGLPSFAELASRAGLSDADAADRRIVERLLWDVPVPPFYYDVAGLVRDGSFPRVITTSYDDLLERALIDAGLRRGNHFVATDLIPSGRAAAPSSSARLRIVRCHGAPTVPRAAMDRALGSGWEPALDRLVVVGYEFESPGLEEWLRSLDGGELWWVSSTGPGDAASRIGWRGEWHTVTGDATAPETFFGQLSLLLIHLPRPSDAYPDTEMTSPGDAELDALYAQGRLGQANLVKRSIEQRITSSGADPAAAAQLAAQDDEITRLQQESYAPPLTRGGPAREAPPPPTSMAGEAADLMGRFTDLRGRLERLVGDAATPVDADTLAFVDGQIDALRRESTKPEPNAVVVAGASAAMEGLLREVAPYVDRTAR
jgi:hypothetical protein